jgi:outer membrane immunogenic protein
MLKYVAAALVAGTALVPVAASAQDLPFSGPRVEAIVGYDSLRSGEADDGVDTNDNEGDETVDGVGYGVGLGYDFNLGGVVIGAEAEISDSSGEQEATETIDGVEYLGRVETGRDLYVGARVGVPVTPNTLVYAKAGYTNAAVEAGFESNNDVFEEDTTLDGWRVGAGVEQAIGSNAYAKVEYRYSNYNSLRIDDELTGGEPFEVDVDLDRHQVMAGFGLRF